MSSDRVIRQPDTPGHLLLLFHGVGASADDLAPLGEALAHALPRAWIVSLQAPERMGPGWQWFSVAGIRDEDRPARVAKAMPGFVTRVHAWQAAQGLRALGGSVTLDRFPGLGHGIDLRVVQALVHNLGHAALELEPGHRV
jgi:predicted esterase